MVNTNENLHCRNVKIVKMEIRNSLAAFRNIDEETYFIDGMY